LKFDIRRQSFAFVSGLPIFSRFESSGLQISSFDWSCFRRGAYPLMLFPPRLFALPASPTTSFLFPKPLIFLGICIFSAIQEFEPSSSSVP